MTQTAIQWLIEQCPRIETIVASSVLEEAIEMEKQQIIDAYIDRMDCTSKEEMRNILGNQYYNETFVSKK